MKRRAAGKARRVVLATTAAAAAAGSWWWLLGGPRVVHALAEVDVPSAALGLLLLSASQLFRLLRWHVLLLSVAPVGLGRGFRTLYASELLNTFLPVKLGDAGRAVAISRLAGFTLGSATATIVADRLAGILVRLAVLPLAALLSIGEARPLVVSTALFGGALAAAAGGILVLRRRPDLASAIVRRGLRLLPERIRGSVEGGLSAFASSLSALGRDPSTASRVVFLSVLALGLQAAAVWLLFRAAGATLGALTALVGTASLDLLAVLPAPPAGIGVAEWSLTFVFAWTLGAPAVPTAAAAIVFHGLWLLLVLAFGAASTGAVLEMLPRREGMDEA